MKEYFVCFVLTSTKLLTTESFDNTVVSSDETGLRLYSDIKTYIAEEKYCFTREITIISICPLS